MMLTAKTATSWPNFGQKLPRTLALSAGCSAAPSGMGVRERTLEYTDDMGLGVTSLSVNGTIIISTAKVLARFRYVQHISTGVVYSVCCPWATRSVECHEDIDGSTCQILTACMPPQGWSRLSLSVKC